MEFFPSEEFQALITECISGSRPAWRGLFTRYAPILFGVLRGAGASEDTVEDVIGDVFVKLMEGNARPLRECSFPSERAFHGWFITLAKNHYVDRCRHEAHVRRVVALPTLDDSPALSDYTRALSSDDLLADVAARDEIRKAMSCLSPDEGIVVALAYFQDMTHPEIAAATGRPVGTVAALVSRAREKMRRHLHGIRGLDRSLDETAAPDGGRRDA